MPGPDDRVDPPLAADERTTLTSFLDYHRATVLRKASGLTAAQMAQTAGPSSLTIAGLVNHLALVEDTWFTERFAGLGPGLWADIDWVADPDREFRTAIDLAPDDLLQRYRDACERSRQATAAASSLDQASVEVSRREGEPYSLRWILVHMIEETARHNGHLDLLREHVDGLTGE